MEILLIDQNFKTPWKPSSNKINEDKNRCPTHAHGKPSNTDVANPKGN